MRVLPIVVALAATLFFRGRRGAFLAIANSLLGGGSSGFSISDIAPITGAIDGGFISGSPSTFAQEHLFNGACP